MKAILELLQGNLGDGGGVGFAYGAVNGFLVSGHTVGTPGTRAICLFTMLETPALVAGSDDFAVMGEAVE